MNHSIRWTLIGLLAAGAIVLGLWFFRADSANEPATTPSTSESEEVSEGEAPSLGEALETLPIELFFPAGEWLYPETYEIPDAGPIEARLEAALQGIMAGPRSSNLQAPLPTGTGIGAVFLLEGVAYVDLSSEEGLPPSRGSQEETLAAYSLVQTLVTNFLEVEGVVLLWNGRQPATLGGHLDTTRPLRANPSLVAR